MPWGCVGSSILGDGSGPGTTSCGLPGTFTLIGGVVPDGFLAVSASLKILDTKAG